MVPYGIVGWTGLVGQTLLHQLLAKDIAPSAIATYNSKNLPAIHGAAFETIFLCCMPATKWWVNKYPAEDSAVLDSILGALSTVQATNVILVSTVDVLQSGSESSEDWTDHTYGTHRRLLEQFVRERWPTACILRLPALFGRGLKKNALYDLLHGHQLSTISLQAHFQWYNLQHLLADCRRCLERNIRLLHLVSQPISMQEIVERWFPDNTEACKGTATTYYNLTSLYGETPKEQVLSEMGRWISWERFRLQQSIAASNIGFTMSIDVAQSLRHTGITALEVAPTRGVYYADFKPVSMQSILYGTGINNIFWEKTAFLHHMRLLLASAATKGITTVVFGCPRQRKLHSYEEARDLFRTVGDVGAANGITICVEPNAKAYECEWLNTVAEVFAFVQDVAHPNIRISLDTGNYCMEKDTTPISEIPMEWIGHLQISAAHLGTRLDPTEYETARDLVGNLWSRGYTRTISFEARETGSLLAYYKGLQQFADLLQAAFEIRSTH